jgi:hypothetical protein
MSRPNLKSLLTRHTGPHVKNSNLEGKFVIVASLQQLAAVRCLFVCWDEKQSKNRRKIRTRQNHNMTDYEIKRY